MPPTRRKTGVRNVALTGQLYAWTATHGRVGFDSSTGFILPNTAELTLALSGIWNA